MLIINELKTETPLADKYRGIANLWNLIRHIRLRHFGFGTWVIMFVFVVRCRGLYMECKF